MQLQENPIGVYLKGPQRPVQMVKKRGRPRKETAEHYAAVLRGHTQIEEWFKNETGRLHRSDVELYTAFRQHVFASQTYESEKHAEAAEVLYAVRLRTALNVLGRARRYFRTHHENTAITVMDSSDVADSNVVNEIGVSA